MKFLKIFLLVFATLSLFKITPNVFAAVEQPNLTVSVSYKDPSNYDNNYGGMGPFNYSIKNIGTSILPVSDFPIKVIYKQASGPDGSGTIVLGNGDLSDYDDFEYVYNYNGIGINIGESIDRGRSGLHLLGIEGQTVSFQMCVDRSSLSDINGSIPESNETDNCSEWKNIIIRRIPSVSLYASPAGGNVGLNSLIEFGVVNDGPLITSCTASGDWSGDKKLEKPNNSSYTINGHEMSQTVGQENIGPLAEERVYSYKLTCTNSNGSSYGSETITVCPSNQTWNGSSCVASITPTNGSCSTTHYSCTAGTSVSNIAGATSWTWSCQGLNGGTTDSCSEANSVVGKPDLAISVEVAPNSATAGTAKTFTATIKNQGNASTGASFTNIFQTSTDITDLNNPKDLKSHATAITSTLDSGVSAITSKSITFDSSGTYYMRICADKSSAVDTGDIVESNEANNCGNWVSVSVKSAGTICLDSTAQNYNLALPCFYNSTFCKIPTDPNYGKAACVKSCICINGATNPPYCVITIPNTCKNGAVNPNLCTIGEDGKCLNGAVNPNLCTVDKDGKCLNGASDPVACLGTIDGTCEDGIKNGDEKGKDCGGRCLPSRSCKRSIIFTIF